MFSVLPGLHHWEGSASSGALASLTGSTTASVNARARALTTCSTALGAAAAATGSGEVPPHRRDGAGGGDARAAAAQLPSAGSLPALAAGEAGHPGLPHLNVHKAKQQASDSGGGGSPRPGSPLIPASGSHGHIAAAAAATSSGSSPGQPGQPVQLQLPGPGSPRADGGSSPAEGSRSGRQQAPQGQAGPSAEAGSKPTPGTSPRAAAGEARQQASGTASAAAAAAGGAAAPPVAGGEAAASSSRLARMASLPAHLAADQDRDHSDCPAAARHQQPDSAPWALPEQLAGAAALPDWFAAAPASDAPTPGPAAPRGSPAGPAPGTSSTFGPADAPSALGPEAGSLAGPLYDLVDTVFELSALGFFRRQVSGGGPAVPCPPWRHVSLPALAPPSALTSHTCLHVPCAQKTAPKWWHVSPLPPPPLGGCVMCVQVIAVGRQALALLAGERVEQALTRLLSHQVTEAAFAAHIAQLQSSLWPGGVYYQRLPEWQQQQTQQQQQPRPGSSSNAAAGDGSAGAAAPSSSGSAQQQYPQQQFPPLLAEEYLAFPAPADAQQVAQVRGQPATPLPLPHGACLAGCMPPKQAA